jgi:hypothetical protein
LKNDSGSERGDEQEKSEARFAHVEDPLSVADAACLSMRVPDRAT